MKYEKEDNSLRIYREDTLQYYLYRDMHRNQTLEYVIKKNNNIQNLIIVKCQ